MPAATRQRPVYESTDDEAAARPRRGGGWRTELSHDGWGGGLRNRGYDSEQRPRMAHGETSGGGQHRSTLRHGVRHGERSFGEAETWYDDLALGADFADAHHQPSFDVAAVEGDEPSPRTQAHVSQLLTSAEADAEAQGSLTAHGGDTGSPQYGRAQHAPTDANGRRSSWDSAYSDGSFDGARANDSSGGSWSGSGSSWSGSARSASPDPQFEEGVVRGAIEGELDRLLSASKGQGLGGVYAPQKWKSEMFVMLPE